MIRFRFVEDHRAVYSVKRMCHMLGINRSSFYKWRATHTRREKKAREDKKLAARIKAVFNKEKGLYGAKRITAELNSQHNATPVNHKRVARIMKALGLYGFCYKRKVITTRRACSRRVFPDLVQRNFTAAEPNHLYVGDITYLPVKGGKTCT